MKPTKHQTALQSSWDDLSSIDGVHSWASSTDDEKDAGLCKSAVNDASESTFGGFTRQIQNFSRISITSAGAIEQARRNRVFSRGYDGCVDQRETDKTLGLFHQLPHEMKTSLLKVAMQDSKTMRKMDSEAINKQREVKAKKDEIKKQKKLDNATKEHINALCYYEIYKSPACWNTAAEVNEQLKHLKSKTAKITNLKNQTLM